MRKPTAIRTGDTIAFAAPASSVTQDKFAYAVSAFQSRGYSVVIGECCEPKTPDDSWTDEERVAEIRRFWADDAVKAIICVRGGYGCARLLEHIDIREFAEHPKLFAGFSDITTLHIALNNAGLITLHAPMGTTLTADSPSWVIDALFESLEGRIPSVPPEPEIQTIVGGIAEGRLAGGCVRLICDSLGTLHEIDTKDKILVMEDIDESPHRVDAMLTHLRNSEKLQQAAAYVIGEFSGTNEKRKDTEASPTWQEVVKERLISLRKPTIIGFPIGHKPENMTLPLGAMARLDAERGTLECLEPAATM